MIEKALLVTLIALALVTVLPGIAASFEHVSHRVQCAEQRAAICVYEDHR